MRQPLKDPSTSVGIGILISSSCINIRVAKIVEYELVNSAKIFFWILNFFELNFPLLSHSFMMITQSTLDSLGEH